MGSCGSIRIAVGITSVIRVFVSRPLSISINSTATGLQPCVLSAPSSINLIEAIRMGHFEPEASVPRGSSRDPESGLYVSVYAIIFCLISTSIFYNRYPENFTYPNFFAEDGIDFVKNLTEWGFFRSLVEPFNGYFISGVYLLTELGVLVNQALYDGEFVFLPKSLAIVSYSFLGLCCTSPIIFLRSVAKLHVLSYLCILLSLVPFPSSDFTTIGTIGNLKFAFAYIAFLCGFYRASLPTWSSRIIACDFVMLLCIYTIASSYFALLLLVASTAIRVWQKTKSLGSVKLALAGNISFWSCLILVIISTVQIWVVLTKGLPKFEHYLNEPFEWSKLIEVTVARAYLYPLLAPGYNWLNDYLSIAIFTSLCFYINLKATLRAKKFFFTGCIYTALCLFLLLYNRTGITFHYENYKTTGFDNFFYTYNFIFATITIVAFGSICSKHTATAPTKITLILLASVLVIGNIKSIYSTPRNNAMHFNIPNLQFQLSDGCRPGHAGVLDLFVNPFAFLKMSMDANLVCTKTVHDDFGKLQYYGNVTNLKSLDIFPGQSVFYQKFETDKEAVNGIAIILSTYWKRYIHGYQLLLLDENCANQIRSAEISGYLNDNAFFLVRFAAVSGSRRTKYCFSISPSSKDSPKLAVQLTTATYPSHSKLEAIIDGKESSSNIIFVVSYE